jgi:hypothetical protein
LTVTECDDFHSVENIIDLVIPDERHPNRVFHHDPRRSIETNPSPLCRGVTIFGDGQASSVDGWRFCTPPEWQGQFTRWPWWQGQPQTREAFSFAVDHGVFLPLSTAIISQQDKVINSTIEFCGMWGGLECLEPTIAKVDGQLTWNPNAADYVDCTAISMVGITYRNYGHFLLDGLPLVYLLVNSINRPAWEDRLAIVCPPLQSWHHEILSLLNLDRFVRIVQQPTRYKTLVGNSFFCQHVTYPTRFVRPVFDALKFVVPSAPEAPEKIFIVRKDETERVMRNSEQLVERMVKRGYVPVAPELYSVREQIRMFSRAKIIVGPTSAAFANVGFAPPRAKILEIMAEAQPDQWTRRFSFFLGHLWHGYVARVEDYNQRENDQGILDLYEFSYDLPLDDFEEALSTVEAA